MTRSLGSPPALTGSHPSVPRLTAERPRTPPRLPAVIPTSVVRAVVVTWNGAHLLGPCLRSLMAQEIDGELEVVVVDNGSQDDTLELLARDFGSVVVVEAGTNLGFAGGAALGVDGFAGDFVILLNNDAWFEPGAIAALIACARARGNERVGAVTAKILLASDGDGPTLVNSTGGTVTRAGAGADRDWRVPEGQESDDRDVFGFCGGAALLRRAALDEVGSFDPSLFLYYEDTDLSWRLRAAGWTIRYEPRAIAVHRHAASSGAGSALFRYYNTRNSLIVFGRHAPCRVVAASFVRQSAGLLRVVLARGPHDADAAARGRALWHALRRAPLTLRERRVLWRQAPVRRAVVARYLERARS